MEGAMLGQLSLLVLECCGKHKVNQGWGYISFFAGASFAIGSPMAGESFFSFLFLIFKF